MKVRLDQLLVERALAPSREKAQALILAGQVLVNGQKTDKAGKQVDSGSRIEVLETPRYVSRGGLKLDAAIRHFAIQVENKVSLDIGSSTGGFTDCLLQHGAARVYAIDVAETDEKAEAEMRRRDGQTPFPVRESLKSALLEADKRNIAGEAKPANVGGILPATFIGGPDTIVKQIKQCKEVMGAGVLDLLLQPPASSDTDALMSSLELFGKKVLPRVRDI